MNIQKAYDQWAAQYDTNLNKTRDLEAVAFKKCLKKIQFTSCLEIGCGTGKNTKWLLSRADHITAVDFSEEMLSKAREKITSEKVYFRKADITKKWDFMAPCFDLASCSLVLEHVEDLDPIFKKASENVISKGYMYIGELHPFKQYSGSKARFNTSEGEEVLTCFTHHISEFLVAAENNGFNLLEMKEYFDDKENRSIPRILMLLFQKQ